MIDKSHHKKPGEVKHKKIRVSEAFSKGERILYKEVNEIKKRDLAEKNRLLEEERRAAMPKEYTGMPEALLITHLRKKANTSYVNRPTDAELFDIEDFLQKSDPGSKGFINTETFKQFLSNLYNDSCDMGKVPQPLSEEETNKLIDKIKVPEEEKDELPLKVILRELENIEWRLLDESELKDRVNKLYAEVNL